MSENTHLSEAARLREVFDRSFAERPREPVSGLTDYVLVEASGLHVALPAGVLTSLHALGAVLPMPSRAAALLGLTAVSSRILPVFSLGTLLGGLPAEQPPRAFALFTLSSNEAAGLAFDRVLHFARMPADARVPGDPPRLQWEGQLYRMLDRTALDALLAPDTHPDPNGAPAT